MANVVRKSPIVGFIISALFGAFGLLLLGIDGAPGAAGEIVLWMYRTVGIFLFFVSLCVIAVAVNAIVKAKKSGNERQ